MTGEAVQSASCAITWGYQFELPKCNRDNRSKAPYKIVKQEYLVNSWISLLVGTIGGTLGMFVGISFIGTLEWIIDAAYRARKWINTWRSEDQ